jgi:hypothetical protein
MIYTCRTCRFTFSRVGEVDDCPDCGKPSIREATPEEIDALYKYQAEFSEKDTLISHWE